MIDAMPPQSKCPSCPVPPGHGLGFRNEEWGARWTAPAPHHRVAPSFKAQRETWSEIIPDGEVGDGPGVHRHARIWLKVQNLRYARTVSWARNKVDRFHPSPLECRGCGRRHLMVVMGWGPNASPGTQPLGNSIKRKEEKRTRRQGRS